MRITKRWMVAAVLAVQGCATQITVQPGATEADAPTARLQFQNHDIAPAAGRARLAEQDLRPGDILLSSGPGLVAAGVQLVTLASVSHASLYVGDSRIVEAVSPHVRVRHLDDVLDEERMVLVLRHPDLTAEQARAVSGYALARTGTGFNFVGAGLHVPLTVSRRACELPLVPPAVRDACIRSFGLIQHAAPGDRVFCSQLVLEAYRQGGVPITSANPRLISPVDILHMREGDVSPVKVSKPLQLVGHLKYQPATLAVREQ
jgi:uncharacterized protein YycO